MVTVTGGQITFAFTGDVRGGAAWGSGCFEKVSGRGA